MFFLKKLHNQQEKYFALIGFIHSSIPYFLWKSAYIDSLYFVLIQLIAGMMCFIVLLKEENSHLNNHGLLWYIALIYVFPFQGGIMFFLNMDSHNWPIYFVISVLLLLYFTQSLQFLLCSVCGIFLAMLFSGFFIPIDKVIHHEKIAVMLYMYTICILMNIFWGSALERQRFEKIEIARKVAGYIAHEMRNSLIYFLTLHGVLSKAELYKNRVIPEAIKIVLTDTTNIVRNSLTFIDMILVRLKGGVYNKHFTNIDIKNCIDEAMHNLNDQRVTFNLKYENFRVYASYELLLHVFYNLLKNSYYFLSESNSPRITISSSNRAKFNIIHFKDNGLGISDNSLDKLFQDFYTQKTGGTGMGLSFCCHVMKIIGGKIDCDSKQNKYTQFNLYFPKVKND